MANSRAYAKQGYHRFGRKPHQSGSFFVGWYDKGEVVVSNPGWTDEPLDAGWYWVAQFPGCMPDGEPSGPFDTSKQAYDDAQEYS